MLTPLQKIEAQYPGGLGKGTKKPDGITYTVSCPTRRDSKPSLNITETTPGGTVLIWDFGGADVIDVVNAWGLNTSDLFPENGQSAGGYTPEIVSQRFRLPLAFITDELRLTGGGGTHGNCLVMPYCHADGSSARPRLRPLNKKPFWGGKNGDKDMQPYGLNWNDGWTWATLNEGESDCWVQRHTGGQPIGLPGNTMLHLLRLEHLQGIEILYVVREHDKGGGQTFVENAVKRLDEIGYGGEVVIVDMRDFGVKDPADLFKADPGGFAEKWTKGLEDARARARAKKTASQIIPGIVLSDATREKIKWIWPGYLAQGKSTMLDGDPGEAKSLLCVDLIARLTVGSTWPDDTNVYEPGKAIIVTVEDGVSDTILPRLEEAGADLSRVMVIPTVPDGDGPGRVLTIPRDAEALLQTAKEFGACLVVIDPLNAHLDQGVNSYVDADVRRALAPFTEAAGRTHVACLLVRHLTKGGGGNPIYRGGGSIGIIGAARIGLLVGKDPDDEDRRVLAISKINIARKPPSMLYRVVSSENDAEVPVIKWEGVSPISASELCNAVRVSKVEGAEVWLEGILTPGPKASDDIIKLGEKIGFGKSTLWKAKDSLGVEAKKLAFEDGWEWSLPKNEKGRMEQTEPKALKCVSGDLPQNSRGDSDPPETEGYSLESTAT